MMHWIDVGAYALGLIVIAFLIARALARTVLTKRPPLGHISDDMKHGERVRHD